MRDVRKSVRETGRSASSVEAAQEIADTLLEIAVLSLAVDRRRDLRRPARPSQRRARRHGLRGVRGRDALPERDPCRALPRDRGVGAAATAGVLRLFRHVSYCVPYASRRSTRCATHSSRDRRGATPSPGLRPSSASGTSAASPASTEHSSASRRVRRSPTDQSSPPAEVESPLRGESKPAPLLTRCNTNHTVGRVPDKRIGVPDPGDRDALRRRIAEVRRWRDDND